MNPWAIVMSVSGHHGEAADPDLLEWIKGFLDHAFDLGPWTVVAILGLLIVSIPLGISGFYLFQQRRGRQKSDSLEPSSDASEERP